MALKKEGFFTATKMPNMKGVGWPKKEKEKFLRALSRASEKAKSKALKGHSKCRACGVSNGSKEYKLDDWTWPEGLEHYVREHDHMPRKAFIDFILGLTKKRKPKPMEDVWAMDVSSSNILKAAYSPAKEQLRIEFKNGSAYLYEQVSVVEFTEFTLSESKGKWFQDNIRHEKEFLKLDD